jgi:hypothetical protein
VYLDECQVETFIQADERFEYFRDGGDFFFVEIVGGAWGGFGTRCKKRFLLFVLISLVF